MLKDITKITRFIFNQFIVKNEQLKSPRRVYDLYRALEAVIDNSKLVSEHYLAVEFSEEFLQNSSWGEPSDKWRRFFNEDLESLNESIKNYLHKLSYLSLADEQSCFGGFMSNLYNSKVSYAFIRDEYNVGFVEPCGLQMISTVLDTKFDNENYHIQKFKKTDLSSFEQRKELQNSMREKTELLQTQLQDLKSYMKQNFTLDDLI